MVKIFQMLIRIKKKKQVGQMNRLEQNRNKLTRQLERPSLKRQRRPQTQHNHVKLTSKFKRVLWQDIKFGV